MTGKSVHIFINGCHSAVVRLDDFGGAAAGMVKLELTLALVDDLDQRRAENVAARHAFAMLEHGAGDHLDALIARHNDERGVEP